MSPRRFAGWEPAVVHEHHDAEGNLTGTTVVTREPEWDEAGRGQAEALLYLNRTECSGCGNDLHVSLEPGHDWFVDDSRVCHACAAKELWGRRLRDEHRDDQQSTRPGFWDGRALTVRPARPDDG